MSEPAVFCSSIELVGIETSRSSASRKISSRIGLAELDAGVDLAVVGGDHEGVVVLLDRLAGLEQRVDQVIGLGTGADALQARPDLSAGPGDRVAFQAGQVLAAEDRLAPRRVAGAGHVGEKLLHLLMADSCSAPCLSRPAFSSAAIRPGSSRPDARTWRMQSLARSAAMRRVAGRAPRPGSPGRPRSSSTRASTIAAA